MKSNNIMQLDNVARATLDPLSIDRAIAKMVAAGRAIDIIVPTTIDEVKAQLLARQQIAAEESAKRGFLFLVFRKLHEGQFEQFIESEGLERSGVYRDMAVARFLLALPEERRKQALELPKSRLLKLASLPPETIAEKLEDGTINKAQTLRELEAQVEKLRVDNGKLKAERDDERRARILADRRAEGDRPRNSAPEWYTLARTEAVYAADVMTAALDLLDECLRENYFSPLLKNDPLRMSVAGTAYHALHGVNARLGQLAQSFAAEYGPRITGGVDPEHQLTPDEAALAEKRRRIIIENARIAADNRKAQRKIESPKPQVGRPPKVKPLKPE